MYVPHWIIIIDTVFISKTRFDSFIRNSFIATPLFPPIKQAQSRAITYTQCVRVHMHA